MAFKAEYETEDQIPEELRPHFVAGEDGKFRPQVEAMNGWSFEDVSGLRSALEKRTRETREAVKTAKALETEKEGLESRVEELTSAEPPKDQQEEISRRVEEAKSQLTKSHEKQTSELGATLANREAQLEKTLIENAAVRAITDPEIKGSVSLLLPVVKAMARLKDADSGEKAVEIFDPSTGDPRLNGKAEPMNFADLLAELREKPDYAQAFEGSGQSGSGMPPDNKGGGGGVTPESVSDMSMDQYKKAREEGAIK